MTYQTLIDGPTLSAHLHQPGWTVVDCRFNLLDPEAGRRAYASGHIPGARYAHLDTDLSSAVTSGSGRHPLPEVAEFAARLGTWGIDRATQVVAYDDAGGSVASRLWYMLRWLGGSDMACAVLDGGWQAWQELGLAEDTTTPSPTAKTFTPSEGSGFWLDTAAIETMVNQAGSDQLLVDARTGERFRGEQEPIDPIAGHVPGAVNLPLGGNLEGGRFLPADALRRRFQTLLGERSPSNVVHMCGSGVSACHNVLAMEIAGMTGSRVYTGSWSEWIRDSSRPVATT